MAKAAAYQQAKSVSGRKKILNRVIPGVGGSGADVGEPWRRNCGHIERENPTRVQAFADLRAQEIEVTLPERRIYALQLGVF